MGDYAALSGGTQESNGNPTDERKWKFTVFFHQAQCQGSDRRGDERGGKLIKILRLFVERRLGGLRETQLKRKGWMNPSSGHSERDQD